MFWTNRNASWCCGIIDCKDRLADEMGLDSFIFGFKLATESAHELKKYDGHLYGDKACDLPLVK